MYLPFPTSPASDYSSEGSSFSYSFDPTASLMPENSPSPDESYYPPEALSHFRFPSQGSPPRRQQAPHYYLIPPNNNNYATATTSVIYNQPQSYLEQSYPDIPLNVPVRPNPQHLDSTIDPLPPVGSLFGPIRTNSRDTQDVSRRPVPYTARRGSVPSTSTRFPETHTQQPPPTIDTLRHPRRESPKRRPSAGLPLEKTFACTQCGTKFARNHDLTRHHKVHDPIKGFRCTGCDRSFTRKDALRRHNTQKRCGITPEMEASTSRARGRGRINSSIPSPPNPLPQSALPPLDSVPYAQSARSHPPQIFPEGVPSGIDDHSRHPSNPNSYVQHPAPSRPSSHSYVSPGLSSATYSGVAPLGPPQAPPGSDSSLHPRRTRSQPQTHDYHGFTGTHPRS